METSTNAFSSFQYEETEGAILLTVSEAKKGRNSFHMTTEKKDYPFSAEHSGNIGQQKRLPWSGARVRASRYSMPSCFSLAQIELGLGLSN